jgi:VCBS repeat protein
VRSISVGLEPLFIAGADLDADADIDLATCNFKSDSVSVIRNAGSLSFVRVAQIPVAQGPLELVLADVDLDGRNDLTVSSFVSGSLNSFLSHPRPETEADCNANGVPDSCDIAGGLVADADGDSIPDTCEAVPFHRGDPNDDGATDMSDGIHILLHLFGGAQAPSCLDSADANADLLIDLADAIYLLGHLFQNGASPPPPGPAGPGRACGQAAADSRLGCTGYASCAWVF